MQQGEVLVRDATAQDVPQMADSLARAFYDDPLTTWMIPDESKRVDALRPTFAALMQSILKKGYAELSTTRDARAAAMWYRPGKPKPPPSAMLGLLVPSLRKIRDVKIVRAIASMQAVQKRHPKPKHWYLGGLGTDPDFQRRGYAGALLRPILERCDAAELPAYLETQKEINVSIYAKFGFKVTGELDLPMHGPHIWLMWREPQRP